MSASIVDRHTVHVIAGRCQILAGVALDGGDSAVSSHLRNLLAGCEPDALTRKGRRYIRQVLGL